MVVIVGKRRVKLLSRHLLRKALGLEAGDRVVFRLVEGRAVIRSERDDEGTPTAELEKAPDLCALAGSVPVPAEIDPADWPAQREIAWAIAVRNRV